VLAITVPLTPFGKDRVERSEYDKLERVEDRMWWFRALHWNLLALSHRVIAREACGRPILDAGCGTGGFLSRLAADYPDRLVLGLDADLRACAFAAAKSGGRVCAGSAHAMPFPDGAFSVIFSADVLCHSFVDEHVALRQFHRCLAADGWLILNLPAYRWMLSPHDVAVHNVRRYTVSGLDRLLRRVGFRPVYATYWNMVLFPVMAMSRKLVSRRRSAVSDVKLYPRPIDAVCRAATRAERIILDAGLRLPFGGSVLAVAAKEGDLRG
jgi:SAM-dependent methyltransferase